MSRGNQQAGLPAVLREKDFNTSRFRRYYFSESRHQHRKSQYYKECNDLDFEGRTILG